jgi:hypothetical protein
MGVEGPADHGLGEAVDHGREISEECAGPDIRDVPTRRRPGTTAADLGIWADRSVFAGP